MENKKIEQLNEQDLEKVNGGTSEVKGNRYNNPLRECPLCGGKGQTAYGDGCMYFVCWHCNNWFWFDDDGNMCSRQE